MALRKALSYSKKKARPFTRKAKITQKAYIKAVPPIKIVKFHMGDMKAYESGKHHFAVRLIADESVMIRDNALESARMVIGKIMEEGAMGQYYFAVKVYPHHILRENKGGGGGMAGADRVSSGMSHSFGINIGRAAIVNEGKEVFFISCENEKTARIARDALIQVKSKVPCRAKVLFEKLEKPITN
ncbi:MAG: 50S ribosomal protein L16 [Nanoarchaeota archaeon]